MSKLAFSWFDLNPGVHCQCYLKCNGEDWIVSAGRVGHLAVFKTLPSKCSVRSGGGRGGSGAFAAKYQIHIHFTNNSTKIKTQLKFPIRYLKSQKKPTWGFSVVTKIC